jgi:transketolase
MTDRIANTIRSLALDAIDQAKSGHPGLPLGCGEIFAYLYGSFLRVLPEAPEWLNRDRFILSAGHGSAGLYAALHLRGFIPAETLPRFRQLHSPLAGHPEYKECPGVEMTTGPLGQGIATAIGIALGQKMAQANFSDALFDSKVVVLAGDGCLMEGISSEASSLAGHLKLNNLILIYDANDICLDGPTTECFTEDVAMRYRAYGWEVQTIDGHSIAELQSTLEKTRETQNKPVLIIAKTQIGKFSPSYAGSSEAHGKPFGPSESAATKKAMGLPESPLFHVTDDVYSLMAEQATRIQQRHTTWQSQFASWQAENPDKARRLTEQQQPIASDLKAAIAAYPTKDNSATRSISGELLQLLHDQVPHLIGGSADLSCSDNTLMKSGGIISPGQFSGRNIKYGVREFAMGAMASGLILHGLYRSYCGTFMTFSDYMRNAIRLAALMQLPVIYQFTHDSIFLGEDGPTHQPVEHLAALRAMPNLVVLRPADANEVKGAWWAALQSQNPVALVLSRQNLPTLTCTNMDNVAKGGYIVQSAETPEIVLFATGSELHLALDVANALTGRRVQVVSMVSFEYFDAQSAAYRNSVIAPAATLHVAIEAQSSFGWHKYIGRDGLCITIDHFGLSAPASDLAKEFHFDRDSIVSRVQTAFQLTEKVLHDA